MSGVVKGVAKVFKKVVKVVKKVLPVILAAAAIYFTAGAALGVAGTAGGWGGAASGLVGKLGLGSTLSSVLTGAVTQAGYGAVLGGGLALVTGGDVGKGLLRGAAAGAITGGITGAITAPRDGAGRRRHAGGNAAARSLGCGLGCFDGGLGPAHSTCRGAASAAASRRPAAVRREEPHAHWRGGSGYRNGHRRPRPG